MIIVDIPTDPRTYALLERVMARWKRRQRAFVARKHTHWWMRKFDPARAEQQIAHHQGIYARMARTYMQVPHGPQSDQPTARVL